MFKQNFGFWKEMSEFQMIHSVLFVRCPLQFYIIYQVLSTGACSKACCYSKVQDATGNGYTSVYSLLALGLKL